MSDIFMRDLMGSLTEQRPYAFCWNKM